ncbi:hypothetical protein KAU34_07860, partial [candidate division WOR-3 bacterium]|nr:hypothetical protein [candidate division WOR-3 bacterium]
IPNSARKPYTTTTDVKATKFFYLGPLRYEFLVEVKNIFDRSNTLQVYRGTGQPWVSDYDDYKAWVDAGKPEDQKPGTEYDRDPRNWGSRRQIYLGVALGFGM